ncbi:60S ribosomal protein L7, putative [Theileria equi strain WA]|uniref:60S ribosomal protein L7, putative n=1 Tax=Theileria equi strain WA TaxID=1537102 RepID=L1LD37_THEEQ|nr:60S ribosomal protein L7, putative [Theileria equi strain WA]EKX73194.1 60S ribosomal protein L7, putative [Theileria equi strain WA]|eukprot:XP_004832646.1 60S ribosomal protein L7, putative [Theileria equi strain WA]
MESRFIIKSFHGLKKESVNEGLRKKMEHNAKLRALEAKELARLRELKHKRHVALKQRALKYAEEYLQQEKELVELRRKAKAEGSFYKEPEAKVVFVVRIKGINKLTPKPKLILRLFRLLQLHNGVFIKMNKATSEMLKLINPYVTYGYPSLGTIRKLLYKRGYAKIGRPGARQRVRLNSDDLISEHLGEFGIHGVEDLVHEIYTCGPHFKEATNFLWPFKLSSPRKGFVAKRHGFSETRGGDAGNREELINKLLVRMI